MQMVLSRRCREFDEVPSLTPLLADDTPASFISSL